LRLLLDTHALLWWLADDPRLGKAARSALADPDNAAWVSSVSIWEARIKERLGKLRLPPSFADAVAASGFVELPFTVAHAHAVEHLPDHHRDPFDRALIAQAGAESLTLVTADARIGAYDVAVLPAS
jgi:PIN domain nuclease of toxin-antitoxin system